MILLIKHQCPGHRKNTTRRNERSGEMVKRATEGAVSGNAQCSAACLNAQAVRNTDVNCSVKLN